MTYDQKCYDLALFFLADYFDPSPPVLVVSELALKIQQTIEEFIRDDLGKEL